MSVVRRGVLLLVGIAFLFLLIALASRAADAPATSDIAVIESYTLLASKAQLLLGAYSRFQWHHPGPLYFYLLAPFYELSGEKTAGLNAGAVAIALTSMAIVVLVMARRSLTLGVVAGAVMVLFAWRAAEALASPWNPLIGLLPLAAALVVSSDVVGGRAWMLPLTAALASVAAQAHVALAPAAVIVGGVAAASVVVRAFRTRSRSTLTSLAVTLIVLACVWALPAYEQFTGQPHGNMTELWQFFRHQAGAGQPLGVAVSAWSDMFVGLVRPDFYVARGWPFVESPVHWAEWLTLGELAAAIVYAARGFFRRDAFEATLGLLVVVTAGVSLWSATRIAEKIFDHDVFWIVGVGLIATVLTIELLVSTAAPRIRWMRTPGWALCVVLIGASAVLGVRRLQSLVIESADPPADAQIARQLAGDLLAFMETEHVQRPLVKIDQDTWGITAGAILELQKHGRLVSVEEDWVVMFTPVFRPTGHEDAVLVVAAPAEHLRLRDRGAQLISAHDPVYAHLESLVR